MSINSTVVSFINLSECLSFMLLYYTVIVFIILMIIYYFQIVAFSPKVCDVYVYV